MSSVDIAEITGKDHANVLKDIRRILEEAEIDAVRFNGVYLGANGQERPCFHLPRRECDLVMTGYSAKYRLAIIDRWHDLEGKAALPTPEDAIEALKHFVARAEQGFTMETKDLVIETMAELLEAQKPAVDCYSDEGWSAAAKRRKGRSPVQKHKAHLEGPGAYNAKVLFKSTGRFRDCVLRLTRFFEIAFAVFEIAFDNASVFRDCVCV